MNPSEQEIYDRALIVQTRRTMFYDKYKKNYPNLSDSAIQRLFMFVEIAKLELKIEEILNVKK